MRIGRIQDFKKGADSCVVRQENKRRSIHIYHCYKRAPSFQDHIPGMQRKGLTQTCLSYHLQGRVGILRDRRGGGFHKDTYERHSAAGA